MSSFSFIEFILFLLCKPIVIDSMIYTVNIDKFEVQELRLKENIIDYSFGDYIYVLTDRYLYKIDYQYLALIDHIPLPQRYNGFTINNENIMLITANEVIVVDKNNLAFKSGIGIERGDYRPIVCSAGLNASASDNFIYLITHTKKNSVIKNFDVTDGRLIKKISVDRVISFACDNKDNTLTTLDKNNRLIVYDVNLNKKKVINLKFGGQSFNRYKDGYIVYNRQGIFFANRKGRLIDFQPMINDGSLYENEFLFLVEDGLVYLDRLTFRVKQFIQNSENIVKLFKTDYLNNYIIAIDNENNFYFIDITSLRLEPMVLKRIPLKGIVFSEAKPDSLWYFQFGAFADYDNAIQMYNYISQKGVPVFIDSIDIYRIKLGGFSDKMTGVELIEKLNLTGWFIIQKKIEKKGSEEFYAGSKKYIFEDGIIREE